ncbi:MAG: hypothetical protein GY719_25910 [bacterium]|nr:hypothetical protein [bacterium]
MSNKINTRRPIRAGTVRKVARMRAIGGIPVHMARYAEAAAEERRQKMLQLHAQAAEIRKQLNRPPEDPPEAPATEDTWGDTVLWFLSRSAAEVQIPLQHAQDVSLRVAQRDWDDLYAAENPDVEEETRQRESEGRPAKWGDLDEAHMLEVNGKAILSHALVGADLVYEDESGQPVEVAQSEGAEAARQAVGALLFDPVATEELIAFCGAFFWAADRSPLELASLPKGQALPLEPKAASALSTPAPASSTKNGGKRCRPKVSGSPKPSSGGAPRRKKSRAAAA